MNKQIVKTKNALGLKIWIGYLGYKITNLAGQGFTARLEDKALQKKIKKQQHYVLVTDALGGNSAAHELGAEYEMHLRSPEISDETNRKLVEMMSLKVA